MNELIREYLLFYDCGDTASVFIPGMMLACFITPAGCPDSGCDPEMQFSLPQPLNNICH